MPGGPRGVFNSSASGKLHSGRNGYILPAFSLPQEEDISAESCRQHVFVRRSKAERTARKGDMTTSNGAVFLGLPFTLFCVK
jgi:hypothetical protein